MYTLSDIKTGFEQPELVKREVNRLFHTRGKKRRYNTAGSDVFSEDWDTLVILDACRYDFFQETVDIDGRLKSRTSLGSTSREWVAANFANKTLHDTVYVSANLWYSRIEHEIDAEVYDFIRTETNEVPDDRNSAATEVTRRGMHPETVTDTAIDEMDAHPNKRFIVHYMQPHQPYIGPTGNDRFEHDGLTLERFAEGKQAISDETLHQAYEENLKLALEYIEDLLEFREDRTVISADHGEMLGDRYSPIPFRDYGHPEGIYCEQLVKVPWFIIEDQHRPEIIAEEPEGRTYEMDPDEVEQHLRNLGYLR